MRIIDRHKARDLVRGRSIRRNKLRCLSLPLPAPVEQTAWLSERALLYHSPFIFRSTQALTAAFLFAALLTGVSTQHWVRAVPLSIPLAFAANNPEATAIPITQIAPNTRIPASSH